MQALSLQLSMSMAVAAHVPACPRFPAWQLKHGKAYGSVEAAEAAEATYTANCARYESFNAVPGGARFDADEHADLTAAEFSARLGGCLNADDAAGMPTPAPLPRAGKSKSIDWRLKGQVTPVKNQGAFGTCWSFAAAENLEGLNVRQGNVLANISEQEFISCCPQCQGTKAENTFAWLANNTGGRPALEASYPYVGKPGDCHAKTAPQAPAKLSSWGRVNDDGTGGPVVDALMTKGPMGMGVDATCFQGYKHGVIRNCTSKGVDHAVLMVAAGTDDGVNYFTIKNSWSAKWGEAGYVRIEQGHAWWGKISTVFTN